MKEDNQWYLPWVVRPDLLHETQYVVSPSIGIIRRRRRAPLSTSIPGKSHSYILNYSLNTPVSFIQCGCSALILTHPSALNFVIEEGTQIAARTALIASCCEGRKFVNATLPFPGSENIFVLL